MQEESPPDEEEYVFNDDLYVGCWAAPRCPYSNSKIQKAMMDSGGCIWCQKIWFDSDGNSQVVIQPGEA